MVVQAHLGVLKWALKWALKRVLGRERGARDTQGERNKTIGTYRHNIVMSLPKRSSGEHKFLLVELNHVIHGVEMRHQDVISNHSTRPFYSRAIDETDQKTETQSLA